MRRASVVFALAAVTACSASDDGDDDQEDGANDDDDSEGGEGSSGAEPSSSGASGDGGTVTLTFSVSNGVRANPGLEDPLVGPVYGEVYHSIDVTLTGPVEGAVPVGEVAVDDVDLTTPDSTGGTWTSDPLEPGNYIFLGAFDLDRNSDEFDGQPDAGDPVTLPTQKFDIVAGEDTMFTVVFDLVYA